MTNRVNRVFYNLSWATLALALLVMLTGIYWLVYPYRGLYNVPQPFPLENRVVAQGSLASYTVSYCVDENLPLPITVSREMELQNDTHSVFPLAPPISYLIKERCETRKLLFGVPSYIPLGTYHVHYTTELSVNPFRDIQQSFVSDTFEVVEDPKIKIEAEKAAELVRREAEVARARLLAEAKAAKQK